LLAGEYNISSQIVIHTPERRTELWSAKDALVLKAISIILGDHLKPVMSRNCYHLKDHGGAKAAVRATARCLKQGQHVMKSDVKSYYASIDHGILFSLLQEYVPDRLVQNLLWQYLRRTVYCDGYYSDVKRGISLGCPLSPLMGALYLKQLDDMMEKTGLFYARFMDDWIVIAPTRWKLRSAVRIVNATLNVLKVEQHPDKTFIGRVERGFDFLGYFLKPGVLRVSRGTFVRFTERITQLYEQGAGIERIGVYVKHWFKWVRTGLSRKDWVEIGTVNRKRQYSPFNGEYWRLCCDSSFVKGYSAIINCFPFPSTSDFCT
jgi:RNA-directed DNA polymerase